MPKQILLSGGPKDGLIVEVADEKLRYYIIRALKPGAMILIGMEIGTYLTTGEFTNNHELFTWKGWESENNKNPEDENAP
jgi:hypothetical protein